jgi:hypothetical protein
MLSANPIVGVVGIFFFVASTVSGQTWPPTSLTELVRAADLIIRGQVQTILSGPRQHGAPGTTVVMSVLEQWKGTRISTLRLVQPRGTEGEITQEVPSLPTFRAGEEVILFLVREPGSSYSVLGAKQGKFSVRTDPVSGKRVIEDLTGAQFDLAQFIRALEADVPKG